MIAHVHGCQFLLGTTDDPKGLVTPESISEEQRLIAATAREFVDGSVRPRVAELEALDLPLTVELLREAGDLGLTGIGVPEAHGGLGLDLSTSVLVEQELARAGSFSNSFGAHTGIGTWPVQYFGTVEQKRRYLPALASGRLPSAYALTEAGSGSDALAARTTATLSPDGQEWVLNGTKQFITNSGFADLFTLYAKVDGQKFSAFLIESGTPGLSTGAEEHKMGLKGSSTRTVQLENVRIPRDNLLGEVGRGHIIAFTILNLGLLKLAAAAVGASKQALALATAYAHERRQFGQPIIEFGLVREKLAEMTLWIYAAETLAMRTAGLVSGAIETLDTAGECGAAATDALSEHAVECAINKVLATEALDLVADEAVQIHGGNGFMDDYEVSRLYRDARINRIFEGTNEINRRLIVNRLTRQIDRGTLSPPGTWGQLSAGPEQSAPWADLLRQSTGAAFEIAMERYGAELSGQQEVCARLADLVADVFTVDSMQGRAAAASETIHQDLAELWTAGALERSERICAELASYLSDDRLRANLSAARPARDSIAIRQRVVDAVVTAGGYPFRQTTVRR